MFKNFYEFKNKSNDEIDIFVYGEIISGTDKWDESDVTFTDFKNQLDNMGNTKTINLYVNSLGGSVFTTQGIVAMLQRVKDKGVIINAYIDGIGASCASFLPMIANNIYAYKSSLLMIHHPMAMAWGNVNALQSQIDVLNKIEDSVMMPIYMSKVKNGISEQQIKDLIDKESWLDSKEMSDIFDITILEDTKELVACIKDKEIINSYKNIPEKLKIQLSSKSTEEIENKKMIEDNKNLELAKAKLQLSMA